MNDNDRVDRLAFSIRKLSRWYDAAHGLCVSLCLVVVLCPFITVYMIDDARPPSFLDLLRQSLILFLLFFPFLGITVGLHWYVRKSERIIIDETGCVFVDMLGRRRHLQWEQVTGVRYSAFLDALVLENGKRRVFVQNSFVEPDRVVKFVLKRIPDSARRSSVVEFLCGAFLDGRIETSGPWLRRLFCHIAYVRWGGETRVQKL